MRSATLLLAALFASGAEPEDARKLIRIAQSAEREQFRLAARFLGQEDIRVFEVKQNGRRTLRKWTTYEASILEGSPYYRLMAINGKPLSKKLEAEQDRLMAHEMEYRRKTPPAGRHSTDRYSTNLQQLIDYHDLTNEGEQILDGRPTWLISTRLKSGAPMPTKNEDLLLASDSSYRIDQETGAILRWRLVMKRDLHSWAIGSIDEKTVMLLSVAGGKPVFVPKQMSARVPQEDGTFRETVQSFSNYKRFEADSLITFEPK